MRLDTFEDSRDLHRKTNQLTTETQTTTDASQVDFMVVPTPKVSTPLITMKRKLHEMRVSKSTQCDKMVHAFVVAFA